jgi:hypothetical protein
MDESIHLNDHHSDDATYISWNCAETSGRNKYFHGAASAPANGRHPFKAPLGLLGKLNGPKKRHQGRSDTFTLIERGRPSFQCSRRSTLRSFDHPVGAAEQGAAAP